MNLVKKARHRICKHAQHHSKIDQIVHWGRMCNWSASYLSAVHCILLMVVDISTISRHCADTSELASPPVLLLHLFFNRSKVILQLIDGHPQQSHKTNFKCTAIGPPIVEWVGTGIRTITFIGWKGEYCVSQKQRNKFKLIQWMTFLNGLEL